MIMKYLLLAPFLIFVLLMVHSLALMIIRAMGGDLDSIETLIGWGVLLFVIIGALGVILFFSL